MLKSNGSKGHRMQGQRRVEFQTDGRVQVL
jgi:hypothetical protein